MADARRIKRVRNLTGALAKLLALAPVQIKNDLAEPLFTADFIAQDLIKVFPEFVFKAKDTDNGTDPLPNDSSLRKGWFIDGITQLIPWIIAALQELALDMDQQKKRLKKRIEDSDARMTALEARIAALETAVPVNSERIVVVEDRVTALELKNATLP